MKLFHNFAPARDFEFSQDIWAAATPQPGSTPPASEEPPVLLGKGKTRISNGGVIKASQLGQVQPAPLPGLQAQPTATGTGQAIWQPGEFEDLLTPSRKASEINVLNQQLEEVRQQMTLEQQTAQQQAAATLAQAQQQAEEILEQARRDAETIRQQAESEAENAVQKGWDAGYARASEQVRAEAYQSLAAAAEITRSVQEWRKNAFKACEGQMLDMVREIARAMFGEGISLDSEALQMNFNRILEQAQTFGDLKVFTHPIDAAQLDSSWRQVQFSLRGSHIQIIPSENIKRGGCYIDGQMGVLDARIDTRLNAVMQAIEEEERLSQTEGDQNSLLASGDDSEVDG